MIDFACFVGDDYLAIRLGNLIAKLWPTLSMRDRTFIIYRLNAMITFRDYGTDQIVVRRLGAIVAFLLLSSVIEPNKTLGVRAEYISYSAKYTTQENYLLFTPYFETWARLLTQEEKDEGVRQRGRQIACLSKNTQTELCIWDARSHPERRSKVDDSTRTNNPPNHSDSEMTLMPPQAFTFPKAKL